MSLDAHFFATAQSHFSPFRPGSGTEHIAHLLYSLIRMTRPKTVVEYGSGYSTLFVLRALADNIEDVREETLGLTAKTHSSGLYGKLHEQDDIRIDKALNQHLLTWYDAGEKACQVNPHFYLFPYHAHLYSFEKLGAEHDYTKRMKGAVSAIGHESIFTHLCGQSFSRAALPKSAVPIDWCWNDDDRYREFFQEFWEHLNPSGGIMVFHNVTGERDLYDAIIWMKAQRQVHGDLEVLILEEPHKLNQNGCAILRRTSTYKPHFPLTRPMELFQNLRKFIRR